MLDGWTPEDWVPQTLTDRFIAEFGGAAPGFKMSAQGLGNYIRSFAPWADTFNEEKRRLLAEAQPYLAATARWEGRTDSPEAQLAAALANGTVAGPLHLGPSSYNSFHNIGGDQQAPQPSGAAAPRAPSLGIAAAILAALALGGRS